MEFSQEQLDIFDFAEYGVQNLIVQAVAGAGKTTTLIECANRIDPDKKILLLAHNKSTRDTLKERIGNKPNVSVYTLHGLGWRMFAEHFEKTPMLSEDKYWSYVNQNLDSIAGDEYMRLKPVVKMNYKSNVLDLINKSRQNLKQSEKEIKKLAKRKYGMNLIGNEAKTVSDILKWGANSLDTVDFLDLLWLPSEKGYFTKKYTADIIMLDEAQDASLAQQDVVSRCFTRSTRLFAFGDRDQTINSWAGSDTEAFDHLKDSSTFRRDAKELPLTTNYRCGKKIIEYAKQYTNNGIKARIGAPDGEIIFNARLSNIKDGDMVLCRNIAPLMEVYRTCLNNGKKVYFRGEQLGKNLISNVDCTSGDSIKEIINDMKKRLISLWHFIASENNILLEEAASDFRVVKLLDSIQAMESLPKTVETRNDFKKFVEDVFSDEGKEGIELSTIHRAKGLEADNVFVICPSLIPSKLSTLDWQIEEEQHLLYVMCTRPKNTLNFVSEDEVKPFIAFADGKTMEKELIKIQTSFETLDFEI